MKFILSLTAFLSLFSAQVSFAQDAGSPPKSCSRIEDRKLKGQCIAENAKADAALAEAQAKAEAKTAVRSTPFSQPKLLSCPRTDDRKAMATCRIKNAKIQQDFVAKHAKPEPFVDTSATVTMSCARLEDARQKAKCLQKQNAGQ